MELWTALSSPLGLAVTAGIFLLIGYLIYRYTGGCYCALNLQRAKFVGDSNKITVMHSIVRPWRHYCSHQPLTRIACGRADSLHLLIKSMVQQLLKVSVLCLEGNNDS